MSLKFVMFALFYVAISGVQGQLGIAGDDLNSSLHEILALAEMQRLEASIGAGGDDSEYYDERGSKFSATNQQDYHHGESSYHRSSPDLTNALGVDKQELYRAFMQLKQDMAAAEDGSNYDSDY
ncbi:uncharacterized protein LOC110849281 [Folsomia candida]|uniref:Secreted protein n=1 Tax=Folsomia candida TaxID=158441 RepID=A0A226EG23_FOLCA|nr:uncharacterized protein LOC110849281 [Folsomia candida]OXA56613.1 hypothetical protein Fcan01_09108 [Folsomia candida]